MRLSGCTSQRIRGWFSSVLRRCEHEDVKSLRGSKESFFHGGYPFVAGARGGSISMGAPVPDDRIVVYGLWCPGRRVLATGSVVFFDTQERA